MIIKRALRNKNMHGRQASNERLYLTRELGGRGLIDLEEAYQQTKVRVACYMSLSSDPFIQMAWKNDRKREGPSIYKEAVEALPEGLVEFGVGSVKIEDEQLAEGGYKKAYGKLKNIYTKGRIEKRIAKYRCKELQSELWHAQEKSSHTWLKGNLSPEKTAAIFQMLEQMIETKAWKKLIRGLESTDRSINQSIQSI